MLSPAEYKTLRFFSRPEPIWEDLLALVTYPIARGWLYLAAPVAVVSGLLWVPQIHFTLVPLLFLWANQVVGAVAGGAPKPPLWGQFHSDPLRAVIKPLAVVLIVGVELYLPFLILAQVLSMVGAHSGALTFIQKSPLMVVAMSTLTLIYIPAVFVLFNNSGDIRRVADPRNVISAIARMEGEYIASVGMIGVLVALWGIANLGLGSIPVVGWVLPVAVGVYGLLVGGLVLGRLQARFREGLADRPARRRSDVQQLADTKDGF